jgi:hypothetical protein
MFSPVTDCHNPNSVHGSAGPQWQSSTLTMPLNLQAAAGSYQPQAVNSGRTLESISEHDQAQQYMPNELHQILTGNQAEWRNISEIVKSSLFAV